MTTADTLRMAASLAVIVALIFAAAWLARRTGWLRAAGKPAMRVLATQNLGRASLALVQVEDARLVLGVTANQVTLLHTLPAAATSTTSATPSAGAETASHATLPADFSSVLHAQQGA